VAVEELDRVLHGHDVLVALGVDQVDHRRERRRLARAGRAGHEHQAAWLLGEVTQDRRQAERAQRRHVLGDQAESGAERGALEEDVDAKARPAGDRVGEVELPVGLQALALVVGEDRVDDLANRLRGQRRVVERHQLPALAQHRRRAGGHVEVRRPLVHDLEQHLCEIELHQSSLL
jgi:hypothetical protein